MLITTVNIQAAALPRASRLLEWLDHRDDHLVVLTETSAGPGTAHILAQCRAAGWTVLVNPGVRGDRGCAIVSRLPLTPLPDVAASITLPGRAVACAVPTEPGLTVLGVYVPSSDRAPDKVDKKRDFLQSLLETLRRLPEAWRRNLVLCGDYNVITRDHQPPYPGTFLSWEYSFLDAIGDLGLVDAYRHLHPALQPHSWLGRSGNGYCFDYIHVPIGLATHLRECGYDHEPRHARLTDHAVVNARLDITVDHLPAARGSLVNAAALF